MLLPLRLKEIVTRINCFALPNGYEVIMVLAATSSSVIFLNSK